MKSAKGNKVSLQTFQTCKTNNVIEYKTDIEGKIMVNLLAANFVSSRKIQFTTIQNLKEMLKIC